ncbi:MAG: DinB family protein [Trueperaceae bacterium]|nr:DinB family protein [Trueperaceae bacterium]
MSEPSTSLTPSPSSAALSFLLSDQAAGFVPFERALAGIDAAVAVKRPEGSPYSPAEVLAHMVFWQQRVLKAFDGIDPGKVEHAALSWPSVTEDEWPGLVETFMAGLGRYRAMALDEALLQRPVREGSKASVGAQIADMYMHDVHHLGQLILLRRMLGAWPPPGGGATW